MSKKENDNTQSPILIQLPGESELVAKLTLKLGEYKHRLQKNISQKKFVPPEEFPAFYAVRILETLLAKGVVDTWELSRDIAYEHGGRIAKIEYFERYCAVIEDYATTGGMNATGGTGIK